MCITNLFLYLGQSGIQMHSTKIPQYNHDGRNANTGNSLKRYPCSHSYHHDGQYNFNFPEERGTPLSLYSLQKDMHK